MMSSSSSLLVPQSTMIIVSSMTIVANGLLLLVFLFDPLKIFRNTTTYFLVGLAIVDILTAATQEPMYATCFIMMYKKHPYTLSTCTTLLSVGQSISVSAMNASFLIILAFTIAQYTVMISPLNLYFTRIPFFSGNCSWGTSLDVL